MKKLHTPLIFCLTLAGIGLLAAAASPAQNPPEIVVGEILPDLELEVEPCCEPTERTAKRLAPMTAVPGAAVAPPEGRPASEQEIERMREEARALAPRGRSLEELPPPAAAAEIAPGGEGEVDPTTAPPRLSRKFLGLDFSDSGGFVPPDTQIAAGPEHLVQAVNAVIRLSNKRGKQAVVQTANEHWGQDEEEFLFDPKVVYDPLSERFFMVYVLMNRSPNRSFIMLSVSRSGTPETLGADDWCNYKIRSRKGPTWADYPGLGMNGSWLAISTNNFRFRNNSFRQSLFWVIEKARIVDNESSCPNIKTFRLNTRRDDDGRLVFNPQVAQHQTESGLEDDPLFALNTQFLSFSDQYVLWQITDKVGPRPRPKLTRMHVTGSGYAFPPDATQKGSDKAVDAGDVRVMQQLVYDDGALWAIHSSGCVFDEGDDAETFGCARVVRIAIDEDGTEIDFEDLFGKRDHFLFWPGIGVGGDGDVVAAYQMSGLERRLSIAFNGLRRGAARFGPMTQMPDEFDRVKDLTRGKCPTELPSSSSTVRTGDYVGVSPDPGGEGVWISGEFSARRSGTCGWKTRAALADYPGSGS